MQHLAVSLVTSAALALVPCSYWCGSLASSPSLTRAPVAVAPSATDSAEAAPSAAGIELPVGVHLPEDAVLVGAPTAVRHDSDHSDWRVQVRLPRTTPAAALDSLEAGLSARGWQVQRGSTDVFAVRRSGTRWELIQVLVDTSTPGGFHGTVIDVGIGSRTA